MSKNQIIKDTREVGKTTYLYNLVIQAINDGMNVIVLDSATEHEDKSLLKKVAKKYPEAKVIELKEESKVATYEELNKGLTIFDFPYFDIKNNQSNILCIDLSYFLEKGHEVFDATQDKEEYNKISDRDLFVKFLTGQEFSNLDEVLKNYNNDKKRKRLKCLLRFFVHNSKGVIKSMFLYLKY